MSTISDSQPFSPRNRFGLRAYLAGSGATIALTVAAILAFLGITALVAFNGFPFGAGDADGDAVPIAPPLSGAPEAAALAAGAGASAAVAATPAEGSALPAAPSGSAGAGEGGAGSGAGGSPGSELPGTTPGTGPTGIGGSDVLGGTVGNLEQTAGNVGVDAPLTGLTRDVTQPLDKTLNQTLNGVGGAVGNPKLGDQVGAGVDDVTKNLLP